MLLLNTLSLYADQSCISHKALLLTIHTESLKQSRIVTASGSVGAQHGRGTVSARTRLDVGSEGFDREVLNVNAGSSVDIGGVDAWDGAVGVEVACIADCGVCNCCHCEGREEGNCLSLG